MIARVPGIINCVPRTLVRVPKLRREEVEEFCIGNLMHESKNKAGVSAMNGLRFCPTRVLRLFDKFDQKYVDIKLIK